jgi:Rad3-related DNA helicase
MSNSILDFVPAGFCTDDSDVRWAEQKSILLQVESVYDRYDVIVIPADVGCGKSLIGQTIARWRVSFNESTATLTHRVSLQEQYHDSFPYLPLLKGKARYQCVEGDTCEDHKLLFDEYCLTCPYAAAKLKCLESKNAVFNFQSYILHKAYKDNVIIDEAHNILPILSDYFSLILWKHIHEYPDNIHTHGDVAMWLEAKVKEDELALQIASEEFKAVKAKLKGHSIPHKYRALASQVRELDTNIKKYRQVLAGLHRAPMNYFIEHAEEEYRGELCKALKVRPTTLRDLPEVLWPSNSTKKIIMMSGTFDRIDLKDLGLHGRKVVFIKTTNPIPPERRRIIVRNPHNMSYQYQDKNIEKIADQIQGILDTHSDTKGMLHMTYGLAKKLRPHIHNKRLMWHTKENKEAVLEEFKRSPESRVMVACGMSEGVDLAGPDFRFQVIVKVQWPSKGDKLIDMLYKKDIERIIWDTVRTVRQQSGRICRGADDEGVTYIIDSAFGNLKTKRMGLFQKSKQFWPDDILKAIVWE